MNNDEPNREPRAFGNNRHRWMRGGAGWMLALALAAAARASENVPHLPFAQWAELPAARQLVVGLLYEESEAYHIFVNNRSEDITVKAGGQYYGIDAHQGYFALQYGLKDKWALDLNVGAVSAGWRSFNTNHSVSSTFGLMDWSFGVRYQICSEAGAQSAWIPTLAFRAGAVLPGTFDEDFEFAPGLRSAAIEPELLLRKHFGWPGLGVYGDALYRWNRTTGNDQYLVSIGLFQQIKGWELAAGYRHMQTIAGGDIVLNDDGTIYYPRDTREINDAIEAGFSYTTSKRRVRYGFHTRTIFDGNNTDRKFWIGGSVTLPFGL